MSANGHQMPATTPDHFKLPLSSRQDMVDWVEEAYKLISSDKDMVMRSFDVCGSPRWVLQKLEVDLSTRNACVMRKAS